MATLNQRVEALEEQVAQIDANIHVVLCQGFEPTAEERAQIENAKKRGMRVLRVRFVNGQS